MDIFSLFFNSNLFSVTFFDVNNTSVTLQEILYLESCNFKYILIEALPLCKRCFCLNRFNCLNMSFKWIVCDSSTNLAFLGPIWMFYGLKPDSSSKPNRTIWHQVHLLKLSYDILFIHITKVDKRRAYNNVKTTSSKENSFLS